MFIHMASKAKRLRNEQITFWATEAEDAEIAKAANLAGANKSAWMRMHLLRLARKEIKKNE